MAEIRPAVNQPTLWDIAEPEAFEAESPAYLSEQLITYIGNKRALLSLIGKALSYVRKRLGRGSLRLLDAFAGSGIVSRYFRQYASYLASNDLELYAKTIGSCYLANKSELDIRSLHESHQYLVGNVDNVDYPPGIFRRSYSPRDDKDIRPGERVFYTCRNAALLDNYRRLIATLPEWQQTYFLGPLLSKASIHANTSGVFKGFYKNSETGVGQFGGNGQNALKRILGEITLPFPVFSSFETDWEMCQEDANALVRKIGGLDIAYFDPPYNQHPYGSNYFMLNLLVEYDGPNSISRVSGIPTGWNRSRYNKRREAAPSLCDLFEHTDARFILLSYNGEGFVGRDEIEEMLTKHGKLITLEQEYNVFRGSRNLQSRPISVTEHLFLLERK